MANGSSGNIKFSKTHFSKIVQFAGFMPSEALFGSSGNILSKSIEKIYSLSKSRERESKNMSAKKMNIEIILDVGLSLLDTNVKKNTGSGINLTHNKIKDTMKVIRK